MKTAAIGVAMEAGENQLVWFKYLLRLLRVALLIAVWRAVYAGKGEVGGLVVAEVLTYTLVAEACQAQLDARTMLDWNVFQGTIGIRLLRPVGIFGDLTAEMVGSWFWDFVRFSIPLLALAPLLGVDPRPASVGAGLLFVVSLVLAVAVGAAVDLLFGCITVWVSASGAVWVVRYMRSGITTLLSGAFIPLSLMPWGIGRAVGWLPFASMASAPLRVYIGQDEPIPLLLGQGAWAVALWAGLRVAWRVSVPRLVAFDG
jgi:ABC-2 type transport system permease protein